VSATPLILAVEDEARNVALLRAVLEPAGYRLAVIGSLADARAWLTEQDPDLVLLDIGLPDGSGLELARELRAAPATSRMPIIVASARVLAADRAAAEEAGCDTFLAKPLRMAELLTAIAAHIGPDRRSVAFAVPRD
jgi:Response regulators consisting of a CheY-like receiver domain and a winged-helix DNA-binding domain